MNSSKKLKQHIIDNPQIERIYIDRAGRHHYHTAIYNERHYGQGYGEHLEEYEICEILTREQILERELEEIIDQFGFRPILTFQHFFNDKNLNFMAIITNLTLTSTAPQTFKMTVNDANNNMAEIAGTLSGLSYNADAAQDIAVVDPSDPLSVDIHAVAPQGGTTVTATGNFVSTLQKSDNSGPAFSGIVTGMLVLVNNVPIAILNPVLAFNQ